MKHITTLLFALQLGLLAGSAQITNDPVLVWPLAYQGTLSSNGVPVNGPHDIVVRLFDDPAGGTQIGPAITNSLVEVADGQFTVLLNGWSTGDLSATNLWLETALRDRPSGGSGYVIMSPRQRFAALPRAAVAEMAMAISPDALMPFSLGTNVVDGAILALGSIQRGQIAPAQLVKSVNGLRDDVTLEAGLGISFAGSGNNTLRISRAPGDCSDYDNCYWTLLGNTGTTPPGPQTYSPSAAENWMGTLDLEALELRVNKWRGLRLEPITDLIDGPITGPNLIGGWYQNIVTPGIYAATIGGGGSTTGFNQVSGNYGTVSGGSGNVAGNAAGVGTASGGYATVGGGGFNLASGYGSIIGGGFKNLVASGTTNSTIGGGNRNSVTDSYGTIGGGQLNTNQAFAGFIGGGQANLIPIAAPFATVGGGAFNNAVTANSTIPGGLRALTGSYGQQAYASGVFANAGDAQSSLFVLRGLTMETNFSQVELFLDGGAANQRMTVPNNATWTFHILVTAHDSTGTAAVSAFGGWEIRGVIATDATGNPTLITSPATVINAPVGWIPSITSSASALVIKVTGPASPNIRWVASVRTVEVSYP